MKPSAAAFCLAIAAIGPATAADGKNIDWATIPVVTVPLFYPGQSSHEWLQSEKHKGAFKETRRGDACTFCHDEPEAEKEIGDSLVTGKRLEPTPPKGKNGHLNLKVQAAFDERNAYFRLQWKTNAARPGATLPALRFDGREWQTHAGHRLEAAVAAGKQPAAYEDAIAIMLDDGKVANFAKQGCWLTCHDGERDMPGAANPDEIATNPVLRAHATKGLRKYLPASRSEPHDWKSVKSPDQIAQLRSTGGFLDLIQWRAGGSNPVATFEDGHILESRLVDAGGLTAEPNFDPATKRPRFMFDPTKFGTRSLTDASFGNKEGHLIKGMNSLPFDPKSSWKEGDILPQNVLVAPAMPTGQATGSWRDGVWTVVLTRPLDPPGEGNKRLSPGATYHVGFAVHDDNMASRGHHVGFVRSLGLGVKADIEAVKLP